MLPGVGRHWRYDYRFDDQRRTLSIGPYPLYTLAEARDARDEARKLLRSGVNPSVKQRQARLDEELAAASTFSALADEILERMARERRAEATTIKTGWLFNFARPDLGKKPVSEITAPENLAVLRKVEDRGRYETAKRLRSVIGIVFRYAITTGRAASDPTFALRGALISPPVPHYAAITEADAAGELMRAIDRFEGQPTTHAALRLAPHLFVRPGELRWRSGRRSA